MTRPRQRVELPPVPLVQHWLDIALDQRTAEFDEWLTDCKTIAGALALHPASAIVRRQLLQKTKCIQAETIEESISRRLDVEIFQDRLYFKRVQVMALPKPG